MTESGKDWAEKEIEKQVVEKTTRYGGLRGVITALFKGHNTIWMHDLSTREKVVCDFEQSRYNEIWSLLESKDTVLNVEGWITQKPGELRHLKIETIEPVAEYQAGDLEKFFGIDPDFTGDMSTEDYAERLLPDYGFYNGDEFRCSIAAALRKAAARPAPITEIGEAVKVLNRYDWEDNNDWEAMLCENDEKSGAWSAGEFDWMLPKRSVIAIANYLQGSSRPCEKCAELERTLKEVEDRPVCDCHTWPTVGELHNYTVACEERIAELEQQVKTLRDAAQTVALLGEHASDCSHPRHCECGLFALQQSLAHGAEKGEEEDDTKAE